MPELKVDCPRCGVKAVTADMAEAVVLSKDIAGHANRWEAAGRCRRCHLGAIYKLSRREDHVARMALVAIEGLLMRQVGNWDALVTCDGYVGLIDNADVNVPMHLPDDVRIAYREALVCIQVRCPNAAASMLRLSLDLATKKKLGEVRDGLPDEAIPKVVQDRLANRIQWLIEHRHIPLRLEGLANEVRLSGNDGAHDGSLTMHDVLDLRDFAEAVLEDMFTAAGRLAEAEARRKARRAEA